MGRAAAAISAGNRPSESGRWTSASSVSRRGRRPACPRRRSSRTPARTVPDRSDRGVWSCGLPLAGVDTGHRQRHRALLLRRRFRTSHGRIRPLVCLVVFDGKDARVFNFEEPGNPLRERKRAEVLRYSRGTSASMQITSLMTASSSTSTSQRGSKRLLTTTIVAAGRMSAKCSACTLPIASWLSGSVRYMRVRTTCLGSPPHADSADRAHPARRHHHAHALLPFRTKWVAILPDVLLREPIDLLLCAVHRDGRRATYLDVLVRIVLRHNQDSDPRISLHIAGPVPSTALFRRPVDDLLPHHRAMDRPIPVERREHGEIRSIQQRLHRRVIQSHHAGERTTHQYSRIARPANVATSHARDALPDRGGVVCPGQHRPCPRCRRVYRSVDRACHRLRLGAL